MAEWHKWQAFMFRGTPEDVAEKFNEHIANTESRQMKTVEGKALMHISISAPTPAGWVSLVILQLLIVE